MKAERLPFIVQKGSLVPADGYVTQQLRARGFQVGEIVFATLVKPRNPKFNRLAHGLGKLVQENIEGFESYDAHQCLKRLQVESGVACEVISAMIPNVGLVPFNIPKSFSFEKMGQDEFKEAFQGICRFIVARYWPTLTPEEVEQMAEVMPLD